MGTGNATNCYPYVLWSGSSSSLGAEYRAGHYMDSGIFHDSPGNPRVTMAYSARCVLDLNQIQTV